jgi:TPR repeat protein
VHWYQKAAEQGFALAQKNLGDMHFLGRGVPQDDANAARWWEKAAGQSNAEAQFMLSLMYAHGRGVPRDREKACTLVRSAAEQGHKKAIDQYNKACVTQNDTRPGVVK